MRRTLAGIGLVLAVAAGCSPKEPPPEPLPPAPPGLDAVVAGNTRFACDLYRELAKGKPGENVFVSPVSVSTALAMTRRGATGETAAEMDKVLHLPAGDGTHAAFGYLHTALTRRGTGCDLRQANALFGQQGFGWKADFLGDLNRHYAAGLREVDFSGDTEGTRRAINGWVEEQTEKKIQELFPPRVLTPLSRLVLANAIYFKGEWKQRFDPQRTLPGEFRTGKTTVRVPFMSQSLSIAMHRDGEVTAVRLPYVGDEFDMVIVLPHTDDGLPRLEERLTADKLAGWLGRVSHPTTGGSKTPVELPKFTMTREYSLPDALTKLGMVRAFQDGRAEFDGMNEGGGLYIQAVRHKAFVEVDERGTEAAAATGVVMSAVSAPPPFRADHPFLFLIRHVPTGSVLFLGRVVDPTK